MRRVPPRYLIGIDLGTTNSVMAYMDTLEAPDADSHISVFPIPQLVMQGEVRTLSALPSFIYFPTKDELSAGAVSATWDEDPPMVTGLLARERGALAPNRQVSSAKSWLSDSSVDRRASILPVQAEQPQPKISPVEASARYLMHLRDAWNRARGTDAEGRFEYQDIVLTVPASFDEDARELTVEAARRAGLNKLTLLEEPLAAFYAWIAPNRGAQRSSGDEVRDGELILICDIGGGTTDFTLVRARLVNGEYEFERTAIGEHLLLGGDNLDLAIARLVEEKLNDVNLSLQQRYALRRACCDTKERLLGNSSPGCLPVTILGSGRAVIGQTLSVDLTREEVLRILTTGFLPITAPHEMPASGRPTALRELGLPYAADPAITRHLAAFLAQAAVAMTGSSANNQLARPDAVLFNGGFCTPAVTRQRIVEVISVWFGGTESNWRPRLLSTEAVDSAVARGAVYYGQVRRGTGLRVKAGSARTYYIALPSDSGLKGICVLPAGVEEGTTLPLLNYEFSVLGNRPVSFTLYSSRTRHDPHGEVTALDDEDLHRHPPLVTLLRYGRKLREVYLTVRLGVCFTEAGTLEVWCESRDTPHRWRLQFELRGEESQAQQIDPVKTRAQPSPSSTTLTSNAPVESAAQLLRSVFGRNADDDSQGADTLAGKMEEALRAKRDSWPIPAIRGLCDELIMVAAGRRRSPSHEVRWLNLCGWCLRPGFGVAGDDVRIHNVRTIGLNKPVFADDLRCQVELLVLLRRIAGGINASDQQALYRTYAGHLRRSKRRTNRQLEYEQWRLVASLEHLLGSTRALLGNVLLTKIKNEPENAIWLWSLGRLGARIPLYGPLHSVVAAEIAGEWLKVLLDLSTFTTATGSTILLLANRTNDRARDIDDAIRDRAIARLMAQGMAEESIQPLSKYVAPERADLVRSFGESLPPGLQLVTSSNCLMSLPAFHGPTSAGPV